MPGCATARPSAAVNYKKFSPTDVNIFSFFEILSPNDASLRVTSIGQRIIENGFLLLKEDTSLQSPLAMLHYEYYSNLEKVEKHKANFSEIYDFFSIVKRDYKQLVSTVLRCKPTT